MPRGPAIYVSANVLHRLAHHQTRYAACELDALQPTLKRAARFIVNFAVFLNDERDQLVGMLFHEFMEMEKHAAPVEDGHGAPGGKCCLRGGNCCRDFVTRAQRNFGNRLPCCRIVLDEDFSTRDLRLTVDVNGTGLELRGGGTAGHDWPSTNLRMLGRRERGINPRSAERQATRGRFGTAGNES